MSHEFTVTYTRVRSHAVLGQVLVDPSLPEDEIHLYRIKGDDVVLDTILKIRNPAEER